MTRAACALPVAFLALTACGATRWSPADPTDRNRCVSCTGEIVELHDAPGDELRIVLAPAAEDRALLAPGQTRMPCELAADASRDNFTGVLGKLETGMRVEISGYYVDDARRPGAHLIRPITAIDLYPD